MIDVLVVDDDASLRESLSLALSRQFQIRTAATAEDALVALAQRLPDVMVLDQQMPGMSGTALLEQLAPIGPPAVLMLSASADVEMARQAMRLGAFDCVAKPFDLLDLAARIEAAATVPRRRRADAPFGLVGLRQLQEALRPVEGEALGLERQALQMKRDMAHQALAYAAGNRDAAARSLGLSSEELALLLAPSGPR